MGGGGSHIVKKCPGTVRASVDSANNINKLSLVGIQLSEKYKKNFDVSFFFAPIVIPDEGPTSKRRNSPNYIFQVVASLPTKACLIKSPHKSDTIQLNAINLESTHIY